MNAATDYLHLLTPFYYSDIEFDIGSLINTTYWGIYLWGTCTILAQMFAILSHNTSGLASLTLAGPLSDAKSYIEAQWDKRDGSLGSLPLFMQDHIHHL